MRYIIALFILYIILTLLLFSFGDNHKNTMKIQELEYKLEQLYFEKEMQEKGYQPLHRKYIT